ncbi:DEXDc+HELICc DEXDc+HELICc [Cryptosporidium xiaoi]|uniref:DEXDc+HELICc DEXDc+HELICc n=1 Tax=Cryptosporidium xiaoi TaxID=659607 RepID=A0AAV9Y1X9_9CRYT
MAIYRDGSDRWVLLGGLTLKTNRKKMSIYKYDSFWMSEIRKGDIAIDDIGLEVGELLDKNQNESVISALYNISDGNRYDTYIEFMNIDVEGDDIFKLFEEKNNDCNTEFKKVSARIYFWLNFSINILTKYNCNRGVLTLANSILSYNVIYHLKSTFKNLVEESELFSRRKSLLDFFRRSILEFGVLCKKDNLIKNKIKLISQCSVLNCLDHIDFSNNFIIGMLNIRELIEYVGNEILKSEVNSKLMNMDDILKLIIKNYDDLYSCFSSENNLESLNIDNSLSIGIWFKIMDYLDLDTITNLGKVNKKMYYTWLIYYRNILLPHQRKSVSLLLKRENSITFDCDNNNKNECDSVYDNNWFYNNQIRFLTDSEDYLKYLSIWHCLYIKDMSRVVGDDYLGDVIWSEDKMCSSYLRGIKVHPKEVDYYVSSEIFNDNNQKYYDVCLYLNHIDKKIHMGYKFNNELDIKEINFQYLKTNGGIFCDEPGLGKTLTILSLIEKTANKRSNIKNSSNYENNHLKYPSGVYNLLLGIRNCLVYFVYKTTKNFGNGNEKSDLIDGGDYKCVGENLLSSRSTLIIVPNHLVQHWVKEINKWYGGYNRGKKKFHINDDNSYKCKTKGNMNKKVIFDANSSLELKVDEESDLNNETYPLYYVYDDPSCDLISESRVISDSDIVLISYRMLTKQYQICKIRQEYKRASIKENGDSVKVEVGECGSLFIENKSPLLGVKWYRLVVDEGHNIGNSEITSKLYQQFISKIKSEYKWIMSGTPLPMSLFRSLNTSIPNIFNFLKLPIMYNKLLNYHEKSMVYRKNGESKLRYENTTSLFTLVTKTALNTKITRPIGLFTLITQLGSIIVYTNKKKCINNYLPNLVGPKRKRIRPYINNEFFVYNMLVELTQRNLFCTYYSENNIDSLLHPSNVSYRQELIWNLRFSAILGFTLNLRDYIMDDNKLELIKTMNFSIPSIYVSEDNIYELKLMLENKHELYENEYYYEPESSLRLDFVLGYYTNLRLISCSTNKSEFQDNFCYYKCDLCFVTTMFPLIIPCSKIHMVCVHCIMYGLGYTPINIDFSTCEERNIYKEKNPNINKFCNNDSRNNSNGIIDDYKAGDSILINNNRQIKKNKVLSKSELTCSKKYIWLQRGKVNYCVVCGEQTKINPDFFDRLQVPIEISHNASGSDGCYSDSVQVPNKYIKSFNSKKDCDKNEFNGSVIISSLNMIIELKNLLISNYKSNKVDLILEKLYKLFSDITVININNYLLKYIDANSSSLGCNINKKSAIVEDAYNYIPQASIGLISFSSSKLRYVVHRILKDLNDNPKVKIMIVSSFWQQLDFIYYTLTIILNIKTCRYYPHTPKTELLNTIENFKDRNKSFSVLLLSIELGSHGLDLSCVSKIYILDPIVDESVESQTISRAYRIRSKSDEFYCMSNSINVTYCLVEDTFDDILYEYIKYKREYNNNHLRDKECVVIQDSDFDVNTRDSFEDIQKCKMSANILCNKSKRRNHSVLDKFKKQKLSSQGGKTHLRNHKTNKDSDDENTLSEGYGYSGIDLNKIDSSNLLLRIFTKN